MTTLPAVRLLGVRINNISVDELLDAVAEAIETGRRMFVTYANVHSMNLALDLPDFGSILEDADVVFCDGHGVRLATRLAGTPIKHRFTPPDWIGALCARCVERDFTMYFLGGRPSVAEKAADRLRARFPGLRIVGTHHGHFDKSPGSAAEASIVAEVNRLRPDVLVVGLGMPLQERWVQSNTGRLDTRVTIAVGAMFDYVAGTVYRAPRWMTDRGIEWLVRLIVEPRRLWRRYVIGNPKFFWRVALWRLRAGSRPPN